MVERDDEIKILGEINVELKSGTHKLIEKLSQEKVSQEEALDKFNSMVESDEEIKVLGEINVELESSPNKLIEKLSQKKTVQMTFIVFMYDMDDDASISEKSSETEDFFVGLDQSIHIVVIQNKVHEDVGEDVMEMANDQAKALSDQEVVDDCLDD
ncbi:hypothetical protein Tco_0680678 [Tanacetum coccineum]|uniref:Uncharacterized protein n=1 Tax=Tanacetum coccineum TaxID=301880 RepID=A0ABQ4XL77_9ASTR